jgi:hypothetical protein
MTIGAALAADLGILNEALDEPGADVLHSLHQLGVDAHAAVPSYLGLSVTVDGSVPPFTFATLQDGAAEDVRTSLRLTLPGIGVGFGVGDGQAVPSVTFILLRGYARNICRPRRGSGVAHRPPARRLRARSLVDGVPRRTHRERSTRGQRPNEKNRLPRSAACSRFTARSRFRNAVSRCDLFSSRRASCPRVAVRRAPASNTQSPSIATAPITIPKRNKVPVDPVT